MYHLHCLHFVLKYLNIIMFIQNLLESRKAYICLFFLNIKRVHVPLHLCWNSSNYLLFFKSSVKYGYWNIGASIISSYFLLAQEAVGDTLEELWISYNKIEKLKGINVLKKLKVIPLNNTTNLWLICLHVITCNTCSGMYRINVHMLCFKLFLAIKCNS